MFFDRDPNARRQRQLAYRNELKQEIQMKNSKIVSRAERPTNQKPQTFGLLKNIQIQAENRKNKQSSYYDELRNQIQFERQEKKRRKQEQAQKQRQEQQKIRRDNEMLRQRAEQQKMMESKKKGAQRDQNNTNGQTLSPQNRVTKKTLDHSRSLAPIINDNSRVNFRNQNQTQLNQSKNYYSRLKTSESQKDQGQLPVQTFQSHYERRGPFSMNYLPTYANRVQNQPFNFLPQRKYMDSYFQELLGERRRFEQQASGISELNKIFYQEKARTGKIQSRGLGQLKKLQSLLDEKGANYMAGFSSQKNYAQLQPMKKLTIPSYQNSRLRQQGFRKLD